MSVRLDILSNLTDSLSLIGDRLALMDNGLLGRLLAGLFALGSQLFVCLHVVRVDRVIHAHKITTVGLALDFSALLL